MKSNPSISNKIKRVLSPEDVAAEYGLNIGTLANDRWRKVGIRYFKIRHRCLYRREDVERYVFGNPVETVDSVGER